MVFRLIFPHLVAGGKIFYKNLKNTLYVPVLVCLLETSVLLEAQLVYDIYLAS